MLSEYLMLSPRAEGKFAGVVAMSGSVISEYTRWDKRPGKYGRRFAKVLGCDPDELEGGTVEAVKCMQELPEYALPDQVRRFNN